MGWGVLAAHLHVSMSWGGLNMSWGVGQRSARVQVLSSAPGPGGAWHPGWGMKPAGAAPAADTPPMLDPASHCLAHYRHAAMRRGRCAAAVMPVATTCVLLHHPSSQGCGSAGAFCRGLGAAAAALRAGLRHGVTCAAAAAPGGTRLGPSAGYGGTPHLGAPMAGACWLGWLGAGAGQGGVECGGPGCCLQGNALHHGCCP